MAVAVAVSVCLMSSSSDVIALLCVRELIRRTATLSQWVEPAKEQVASDDDDDDDWIGMDGWSRDWNAFNAYYLLYSI